jgi:hypothetical protein
MKKLSPLKIIRIMSAIMLLLWIVEYFMDDKFKTSFQTLRLITVVTLFAYAMFNSGAIEQEKIEREKAN